MSGSLPNAVTVDQLYLKAILEELGALREELQASSQASSGPPEGTVLLEEPAPVGRARLIRKVRTKR